MQTLAVDRELLRRIEADFFRLLETDRNSPEFEALYRRFDEALGEALKPEKEEVLV